MSGAPRRVTLDLLMAVWGWGTWLGINGIYMQLPLLVERLPEGWALPTSMTLAIQFANSGWLLYGAAKRVLPRVPDGFYIGLLLVIGTLSLALNAFLYDRTALIGGNDRSVAFITLVFFTGFVGCTSSVVFYPYLRHYRDVYLSTYLVGEGLSEFLPSVLALIQGVGGEPECHPAADGVGLVPHYSPPRFSTTVFLLVLAGLSAASFLSFLTLSRYEGFRGERVTPALVDKTEEEHVTPTLVDKSEEERGTPAHPDKLEEEAPRDSLLHPRWVALFAFMVVLNALNNGVLTSSKSYSCMPYGARAYHLAVTLGALMNPTVCLVGVWLQPMAVRTLAALMTVTVAPLVYVLTTAAMSPEPPLVGTAGGEVLIVAAWVWVAAVLAYSRMWVYKYARSGGARSMRACGVIGQLGSSAGSVLMFTLVNYANIYTQADTCPVQQL